MAKLYVAMVVYKDEDGNKEVAGVRRYDNWRDMKLYIDGKNPDDEKLADYLSRGEDAKIRFKGFEDDNEADIWIDNCGFIPAKIEDGSICFDAGTGGGKGVRVRVTDVNGRMVDFEDTTQFKYDDEGNIQLEDGRTNNYGELYALKLALEHAMKNDILNIYGDSTLVIMYWSVGRYNKEKMTNADTIQLINEVSKLREDFKSKGGKVTWISGDRNPADLGYHR